MALHEDKTRLIEFGRLSTERREARGDRRAATFTLVGFTHYRAWSRDGRFLVKRRTDRKRLTRKLHTVQTEQRRVDGVRRCRYVMKNGEIFEGDTLTMIWPERLPMPQLFWWGTDPKPPVKPTTQQQ